MDILKAANEVAAGGVDVLHLELGEPSTGAPPPIVEAARHALDEAPLGYTEALGLPGLRTAIARHYRDHYRIDVEPERVVVTVGSSAGFVLAFLAAFDAGARIGIQTPGYPAYRNILEALGLVPVILETGRETGFRLTPDHVREAGPLDGLLVASPANPTGTMLDETALRSLAGLCAGKGITLISDEIYHGITYGPRAQSVLAFGSEAIVVNSFSKYFCMTGWRLGWIVLPRALVRPVERLAQNLFISPPTMSQIAAVAAFDCYDEFGRRVAAYAENRDILLEGLPRCGFRHLAPADGAFYVYADVRNLTEDSMDFCRRMLTETGIAAAPGVDFDRRRGRGFVRFSFAGPKSAIVEALARLDKWKP